MTESTPARRSGRQRVPTRKYTNDAFEALNVVLSSDSEDDEILQQQLLQDDSDEFPAVQVGEENEDEDEDESSVADASDGSAILTPNEAYEDAHSYASSDHDSSSVPKAAKRKAKDHNAHRDVNIHSRGLPENPFKQDHVRSYLKLFSGEGIEDVSHIVKARDQWAADPTLPTRSSLCYGSHSDDLRRMEATVGWDWYYDQGGREVFAKRQNARLMTVGEALQYNAATRGKQEFLMGPYGRQSKWSLATSEALELDSTWKTAETSRPQSKAQRRGWMLNVGSRVKCMDWAPNHDGAVQYLALVTATSKKPPPWESPAFTPLPGPSVIQLWAFDITADLAQGRRPRLCSNLCTDWGEIKQLKWCPVPSRARESATSAVSNSFSASIGLLALICGDGFARVLDVQITMNEGQGTIAQALKYNGSGFTAPAPAGNLSTCLTWLSSTDLAIGYSNGQLSIYDICPSAKPQSTGTSNSDASQESCTNISIDPTPWLSMLLHSTYILALNSAYPTHPSLLISSSLSGYLRLTSLLAPKIDYVLSSRTRSPPSCVAYCDSLLSAVAADESSETVKIWGLRCFYATFTCAQLPAPQGPGPGILDVGKCHSTIAIGCADGSVMITNPLRKILGKRQAGYQQCIFKHEWRSAFTTRTNPQDPEHLPGLSRITEGYKAEKVVLGVKNTFRTVKEAVPTTTIYEEKTAVTALAWNPNLCCGGWLAVGWGSGLVRIQDVAIG